MPDSWRERAELGHNGEVEENAEKDRDGLSPSPRTGGASSYRTDSIPVRTLLIRKRGLVHSTPAEYHHV